MHLLGIPFIILLRYIAVWSPFQLNLLAMGHGTSSGMAKQIKCPLLENMEVPTKVFQTIAHHPIHDWAPMETWFLAGWTGAQSTSSRS
jgi:hypothetical protein